MSASRGWFSWPSHKKTKRQPIKQHETKAIQDLLNTLNELRTYLTNLVKDLNDMEKKLLETISGISQPVVPKETEKKSHFKAPNKAQAELKECVSKPNSDEAPVSRSDTFIDDVIAGFLNDQTSPEKSFMDHADEVFHTLCNQLIDFLKRNTLGSTYESYETKVERILTDPQSTRSTRRITNLKKGRTIILQIYISQNANLPNGFTDSLCELLKRGMSSKYKDGVILPVKTFNTPDGLDSKMPLIVLCPVYTRLGESVDEALSQLETDEKVILLILHHVARHDMDIVSSTKTLTLPDSTKLGCILDMVFNNEDGIHNCKLNDDTVARITNFLSQYK